MKQVFLIVIFSVFVSQSLFSQTETPYEFGRISMEDVELKEIKVDKDAEALVLSDIGISYFTRSENGFDVIYERTTRIKVLSEAGMKYAEVEIPFFQEGQVFEKIYDLEGITYNYENGILSKSNLNVNNSYDEKLNNYWKLKKFAMPDVKPGSIFEYRYKILSSFIFNLRDWEFQWKIPVIYSQYVVKLIPFYEYVFNLQGSQYSFDNKSYLAPGFEREFGSIKYKDFIYEFTMRNIPAFKDEEFITSINDYITKIDFQLSKINYPNGSTKNIMTTWEMMNKELLSYPEFGKYVDRAVKIGAKIPAINQLKNKKNLEKFNEVIDFVKDNYSWNGMYGKYASKNPINFEKEKIGNIADINLFTIGLLRSVGLTAYPVLLSSRNNGKLKLDYPFLDAFNYVAIVTDIDGKWLISDASEPLSINHRLLIRAINDIGLIIQNQKTEWLDLGIQTISTTHTDIRVEFNPDHSVLGKVTKISSEYDGLNGKVHLGNDFNKIKKRYESKFYSLLDTTIRVANMDFRNKPYAISFDMTGSPEIINDKIYLNPFLELVPTENPLKQNSRNYPIDMIYPDKDTFSCRILIPEGWKVDHLPAEKRINNDLYELDYQINIENESIININYFYCFKNGVYPADKYSSLKFFFGEVISKSNEKIVFSRE